MHMKTLKTLFAVLPGVDSVPIAIQAYQSLPRGEHSRLIGVHVAPLAISYGLGTDLALASLIEAQIEAAEQQRKAVEAAFRLSAEQAEIAHEWRTGTAADYLLSTHAGAITRAAELVIFAGSAEEAATGRHQIEELVFSSGRPVLAVPAGWQGPRLGEKVVVAWDGGREAARAVFDAMPLLVNSKLVRIVSIEGFAADPVRQFSRGDDIAATLSRQGVPVESHTFKSSRRSVKEELLTQAMDIGADMLVMGCYGHSRVREMILGGVSRDMLQGVPYPLLMSS
jgi:nucleotide-binding universal stress UspA family protein